MALLKIDITNWCGQVRASCPVCRRHHRVAATEAEAKALVKQHMVVAHVAAVEAHRAESAALKATLYDADNKLITRMPLADDAEFEAFKNELKGTT